MNRTEKLCEVVEHASFSASDLFCSTLSAQQRCVLIVPYGDCVHAVIKQFMYVERDAAMMTAFATRLMGARLSTYTT